MEVIVCSKRDFDNIMWSNRITDKNVEDRTELAIISIVDTDQFNYSRAPYFKQNHENVINLQFDDCEHDGEPSPTQPAGTKAFSEEQAKELFQFIKRNRNKETIVVHCMAGISRSGAVGAFINGYAGGDWETFKRMNPQIAPNARVERMLNQAKYNDKK